MPRRTTANEPQLKFYQKLILNRYLLAQFGVSDLREFSINMKEPSLEEIDGEGITGFHKQLITQFGGKCAINEDKLALYDLNIVSHMRKINERRFDPLVLKYFQYQSLLFAEYYLDEYFNNRQGFIDGLNAYVSDFNAQYPNDAYELYEESNLNKIAVWNATGSGKTLIMHINYHQYLHYSGGKLPDDVAFILLTPKEGLSLQHIEEYANSNISAKIYDKLASRWMQSPNNISVLENTKLGDKDQDTIVSVKRFGSRNVVFADEGHRGSSSGRDGKWQKYRDELCSDGFSFEYSATFGQAVASSNDNAIRERYAKCIIFDYSYKYFYGDGYGKDYNIINLPDDSDENKRNVYLTACLISFYQQKKLFLTYENDYNSFNIENPLFVFVGASVNAVRTERGRKVSDVVDILLFFRDFVSNKASSEFNIERVISGNTGLLDNKNRDIFRNNFAFLTSLNITPSSMYTDILKTVFNCDLVGANLHIENLRGISGEIQLRLGENEPFGVINVGDDSALLGLCSETGFTTDTINFSDSLFHGINKPHSTINLLIGSKKFTEGWNCWRVSTMGLMNVGRSEGSEIIQLFGRGVRLKGFGMSLKRSNFYKKDYPSTTIPKHINILETLNIFGVRADYMRQFKEFLEAEGVPSDKSQTLIFSMPVIRNISYKNKGLYSIRVKDDADYKIQAKKPILRLVSGIHVELDCYAKVQFETSQTRRIGETTKNSTYLKSENLAYIDYENVFNEIYRYKVAKARYNVNINRKEIFELLHDNTWYKLLISEDELSVKSFNDYKRFESIAISLLLKYFDKFYYSDRSRWESKVVGYDLVTLDDNNENFLNDENDVYTIKMEDCNENETVKLWLENIIEEVKRAKIENKILKINQMRQSDLEILTIKEHLYNPLLYIAKSNNSIESIPIALNESEIRFVKDLKKYINNNQEYFSDKETYLIRNKSKKGIGFFEDKGFYPDFILWFINGEKQNITFIDPHGMGRESFNSEKVLLHSILSDALNVTQINKNVILESFILSPTPHNLITENHITLGEWNTRNVLFMDQSNYLEMLFSKLK